MIYVLLLAFLGLSTCSFAQEEVAEEAPVEGDGRAVGECGGDEETMLDMESLDRGAVPFRDNEDSQDDEDTEALDGSVANVSHEHVLIPRDPVDGLDDTDEPSLSGFDRDSFSSHTGTPLNNFAMLNASATDQKKKKDEDLKNKKKKKKRKILHEEK